MKAEVELMEKIKLIICSEEDINPNIVFTETRLREVKEARQIIAFFSRKHIKNVSGDPVTYQAIGHFIGLKHETVMHACKTVQGWCYTYPEFREKIAEYDTKIKDMSGLYTLNVALLLTEKIKAEMVVIKKESLLLDEIIKKLGI